MFEVTPGDSNHSLKNYGFLYNASFSSRVRMYTNHLRSVIMYENVVMVVTEPWVSTYPFSEAFCPIMLRDLD